MGLGFFIFGLIVGFFVSFIVIKKQISKDGAGQLKVCEKCPYFRTGGDDFNDRF
ncbi:MAG: hypothetical protein IJ192_10710 [Clostridia bacterium]|nr:hypothetical protein [Clostridia bacterium]MBR2177165.1 hypothetical protein [Clostridia bacterium]